MEPSCSQVDGRRDRHALGLACSYPSARTYFSNSFFFFFFFFFFFLFFFFVFSFFYFLFLFFFSPPNSACTLDALERPPKLLLLPRAAHRVGAADAGSGRAAHEGRALCHLVSAGVAAGFGVGG